MQRWIGFLAVLVLVMGLSPARAQTIPSADDLVKQARGVTGRGVPELTDADITYLYSISDSTAFLSDTTVMTLAAEKRLHEIISDKKQGEAKRRAAVLAMVGGDITASDLAYLKKIGYEAAPPDGPNIIITRAHVHYFIHDPELSPLERQGKIHDEIHDNDVAIQQAQQDRQASAAFDALIRKRDAVTEADKWTAAWDANPTAVALLVLVAIGLIMLPVVPLIHLIRAWRHGGLTHPYGKSVAVLCLAAAGVTLVKFYFGLNKSQEFWLLPAPALVTLASFLWVEKLERRHRLSLGCLGGALAAVAAYIVAPVAAMQVVVGLSLLGLIAGASFAVMMPPYTAQGWNDVASRVLALLGCLCCLGFWALMAAWRVIGNI
jgi:hypothetical protein